MVAHEGVLEIDSLDELLVARNLLLTTQNKLRAKSQKVLAPKMDELFVFD